ncbi:MAG: adenylyltransferase/cytidyltransferase family protein [Candidatus Pacearchaeota archaeon]|jgi:cytidyltransferase-like protein
MKKILCFGTFDLLHEGHKEFLLDAKSYGDYLAVIVIHDDLVYENKKRFPKNSQETRAKNLEELKIADKIIKVSNDKNKNILMIKDFNPDIIVLGYDQNSEFIPILKQEPEKINFIKSKEFAGGMHSSMLK